MYSSIWYNSLTKPFLTPLDMVFTPIWVFLYIIILISLILYLFKKAENKQLGYIYFTTQLLLNLLWSPVFFGLQNILLALVIIIFMDIFIYLTIRNFYSVSKISGLILVPYFLWVIFATYLNIGYLILN